MVFPFMELPAELRNRVYDYAAASIAGAEVKVSRVRGKTNGNYAGLTRVCRQIRHEYLPIRQQALRTGCIFLFHSDLGAWLQTFTTPAHADSAPANDADDHTTGNGFPGEIKTLVTPITMIKIKSSLKWEETLPLIHRTRTHDFIFKVSFAGLDDWKKNIFWNHLWDFLTFGGLQRKNNYGTAITGGNNYVTFGGAG